MYEYNIAITSVYDGDTITGDLDLGFYTTLRQQKFRLIYIDTEEIKNKDEILKSKAIEARDFLRNLVEGKACKIKCHGKDKYGRWLAELFIEGYDKSANQILLDEGLAKHYLP